MKACFPIRELGYKRHSDGHLWGNEVNTVTGKTNDSGCARCGEGGGEGMCYITHLTSITS